jgi:hypothetical protein
MRRQKGAEAFLRAPIAAGGVKKGDSQPERPIQEAVGFLVREDVIAEVSCTKAQG